MYAQKLITVFTSRDKVDADWCNSPKEDLVTVFFKSQIWLKTYIFSFFKPSSLKNTNKYQFLEVGLTKNSYV